MKAKCPIMISTKFTLNWIKKHSDENAKKTTENPHPKCAGEILIWLIY
jgi:hypothetical protein